ncbi:ATP-dependent RNA helicase DDX24 [Leptinotarsa decemlineata]|uniref:ATP-dependent RNA helicase DDX24 n=1 Tax=Leptinotarsa decemlineata TaxID=7539 RepID=UPI003D3053D4
MLNNASKWRPVEIDRNLLSGQLDGLVGIEECTDYDLDVISSKKIAKRKRLRNENTSSSKKKKGPRPPNNCTDEVDESLTPSKSGNSLNVELDDTEVENTFMNLEAWTSFGLPQSILKGLEEARFSQPTYIQTLSLPSAILGRKNILGAAETGSGKTLAFGLPILTGILNLKQKDLSDISKNLSDSEESDFEKEPGDDVTGCVKVINNVTLKEYSNPKPLYALILTPTRELAMQVRSHLMAVGKYSGIKVALVVGGMAAVKQERILSKGPEIVVATPGRLWELIQQGNPHLSQIDNIRFLAIDETDRMLEKGHFQELHDILERINLDESKRKIRQYFVFSATLTLVHEMPKHLKTKSKLSRSKRIGEMTAAQKLQKIVDILGISDPKVIDITAGKGTSETLTECRITCGIEEKDYYVYYFLKKHPGRTLIFCNSIGCVKRLATLLNLLDCHPLPLHASMPQRQRIKNLERFRDNENSILVATDVAARGLDIPFVEHVLHYQTPRTSESYVHRSGRTARASREGITILLIEPGELKNYLRLCRTLEKNEDIPVFPIQQNFLNAVKHRVNLARELDKLQLQVRKANSEAGWFQKAAEEMDIIVDDFSRKHDTKDAQRCKKSADIKRKHLASLLATPIFPKGFSGSYPLSSQLSLSLNEGVKEEKAVDLMKNTIAANSNAKAKNIPLFNPRKHSWKKKEKDGMNFKLKTFSSNKNKRNDKSKKQNSRKKFKRR